MLMEHSYYNNFSSMEDDVAESLDETSLRGDELLIELVRTYPHLYDKNSRDYKDRSLAATSWAEIGVSLNLSCKYNLVVFSKSD